MEMVPASQEFTEATARGALIQAGDRYSIATRQASLLRLGENAVFAVGDVIIRVARPGTAASDSMRTVRVARWLSEQQIPAVEALDLEPIVIDDLLVTFWRSLGDADRYGGTDDLARLLRRLHAVDARTATQLPPLDPFARAARRIEAASLSSSDRAFMHDRLQLLQSRYSGLDFSADPTVIHGDANVGNVLIDESGIARLIDLDRVCIGPREWDLVLTAIYFDRYGWHTRREYETFVQVYGVDVIDWAGYETLADVREFLMVTWIAQNIDQDGRTAAEFATRIKALRTDGDRHDWQPY